MGEMPLRIVVINGCASVEGDIQTLLVSLRGFQKSDFEIHVFSKPRGDVYEILKQMHGIIVHPIELGGDEASLPNHSHKLVQLVDILSATFQIAHFVKKQQIFALYTIDRGVAPQIAAFVSRITGCPFVLNAAYPFYPQNGLLARFVLRQAARIHGHSRYLMEHLERYVRDPNRFVIIPHGLELEKYNLNAPETRIREFYGIAQDHPVVVMTGRINQYKGQDDLIKAAAIVIQQQPDTHFLIAGRGPDALKQELEHLIADLGIGHRVRLVGYVPSIPEFLSAANIVAMPSWEEPFGLVALEGMAMAKPVVSTHAGGVPEFVLDKQVGLLVPPRDPVELADAILQLIADPDRAKSMGQIGRLQVEARYTASQYADRVATLLRSASTQG
jgi:glycosyltransferase involved in cell wall biosynthesis